MCLACITLALYVGAETGYGSYILVYSNYQFYMSEADGQYLTSLFWAFITIGRLIAIPLANFFSAKDMVVWELTLAMLSMVCIFGWQYSRATIWVGTCFFGLGMAAIFPTIYSLAESYIKITGRISSAMVFGAAFGEMIFPLLIGESTTH